MSGIILHNTKLSNIPFRAAVIFRSQITSYQMADSAHTDQTCDINQSSLHITAGPTCVGWPHLVSTWTCPYITNLPLYSAGEWCEHYLLCRQVYSSLHLFMPRVFFSTSTSLDERIKTSVDHSFLDVQLSSNSRIIRPGKTIPSCHYSLCTNHHLDVWRLCNVHFFDSSVTETPSDPQISMVSTLSLAAMTLLHEKARMYRPP